MLRLLFAALVLSVVIFAISQLSRVRAVKRTGRRDLGELPAAARVLVDERLREGFDTDDEILELAVDILVDDFPAEAVEPASRQALAEALAARQLAVSAWPAVTECDRLDAVFEGLERSGVSARQNFSCCQTCGHAEMTEIVRRTEPAARGYVFYHQQDTESAAESGALFLAYGSAKGGPGEALAIGSELVAALRAAGFDVDWNGTVGQRPSFSIDWKRRRASERVT